LDERIWGEERRRYGDWVMDMKVWQYFVENGDEKGEDPARRRTQLDKRSL
jgi:hypothetical protein